jgi:UDP-N-acetylglucosamine 2-epimerase (non-hydrolysing)
LSDPLGYIEFQALTRYAKVVVTDSGGIQEETTFLGVQCLTVRENTERPVTIEVGTNVLCGTDLAYVTTKVKEILAGDEKRGSIPELWDGQAAGRIVDILLDILEKSRGN